MPGAESHFPHSLLYPEPDESPLARDDIHRCCGEIRGVSGGLNVTNQQDQSAPYSVDSKGDEDSMPSAESDTKSRIVSA